MSHRCAVYALGICEHDPTLPQGARSLLLAVSIRANSQTSITYTGDWLLKATGLTRGSIWRNFAVLTERGYVSLRHRAGKSTVVGFPVFGFIGAAVEPAGRTDEGGQWHPAICACDWCREATG